MGLNQQKFQFSVDFDKREVLLLAKGPLDLKPAAIKAPFAVLKGLLAKILIAEAEDEITVLTGMGDALTEEANKQAAEGKKP